MPPPPLLNFKKSNKTSVYNLNQHGNSKHTAELLSGYQRFSIFIVILDLSQLDSKPIISAHNKHVSYDV